ncbi:helix-turn-helix transcriptional regulator [Anaerolineae bacterium CFX9]|nr:helix-turn-helix transcriptional regulator [Anaerolineae bacterium CFX9]
MKFDFDERKPDSPFIDLIWRTRSAAPGTFISRAVTGWEIVVTRFQGTTSLVVRGPESAASIAPVPPEAEFLGISFQLGTFMTDLPNIKLVDAHAILPDANMKAFWLKGSAWEFPTYENADVFVERMIRQGLIAREPVVEAALSQRVIPDLSARSIQRRFLNATGLTHSAVRSIQRAHHAAALLEGGASILDVVAQAGYTDQPHLTREVRRYIGQTPAQLNGRRRSDL